MTTSTVTVEAYGAGYGVISPTDPESARLAMAVAAKAARLLALSEAPLGTVGEMTEWGIAVVRPDYNISELLYGLRYRKWTPAELTGLIAAADVVRMSLGAQAAGFPADRLADVERAISAAISWLDEELKGGSGIA